jgi:hypothetical protein
MSVALDLGTFRLKSLCCHGDRLIVRKCRTVHAALPDTPARRQGLEQMRIPFAVCEDMLVAVGDAAVQVSQTLGTPLLPLLPGGKLPHDDPPARQILATLIESALPEPQQDGEYCCMVLPAAARGTLRRASAEYEFLSRLVKFRGYSPLRIDAGMAVVLAQLSRAGFTGIGISFGASSTQATLALQGREVASCSIPQGGDWIDEEAARSEGAYTWDAAGARFVDVNTIRRWKERCEGSIAQPTTRRDARLCELYRDLLAVVVSQVTEEFADAVPQLGLRKPLAVAASGGTARVPGFCDLLSQAFEKSALPIATAEVRVAAKSDHVIARGGLICAQLEAETGSALAAA